MYATAGQFSKVVGGDFCETQGRSVGEAMTKEDFLHIYVNPFSMNYRFRILWLAVAMHWVLSDEYDLIFIVHSAVRSIIFCPSNSAIEQTCGLLLYY